MKKLLFLSLLCLGLLCHKNVLAEIPSQPPVHITKVYVLEVCDLAAGIIVVKSDGTAADSPIKNVTKDMIDALHKQAPFTFIDIKSAELCTPTT